MKTHRIVGLTVGMLLALAQAAYPAVGGGGNVFTTESTKEIDVYNTTTVNQQVNQYSTELIAHMPGGPVLFDQTFNVAFGLGPDGAGGRGASRCRSNGSRGYLLYRADGDELFANFGEYIIHHSGHPRLFNAHYECQRLYRANNNHGRTQSITGLHFNNRPNGHGHTIDDHERL